MPFLVIVAAFLLLMLFGAPLFTIIASIALYGFSSQDIPSANAIAELYRLASQPVLLAIPLFTFAGYMLAESKTPRRLVELTQALIGWLPGGLAIVVLAACAMFTAFTGGSGITIVALGGLVYPILISEKYSENFSLGLVTTSGSLGLLFPPSLPIILYGIVSEVSISQLFLAGIIPGILLVIILSLYAVRQGFSAHVQRHAFEWPRVRKAVRDAAWEIPLPFLIIGGIYGGIITATEAAAVTAFYVLVVEVFVYRDLALFTDVPRVMKESMVLVGAILMILATAMGLTSYLIDQQVPQHLFEMVKDVITSKFLFLMILNLFLIIVGMMMDIFSAIIVVVPLIIPIAKQYGVDPVHLGIIFLANLEIGYLTPPVGLNLFISSFRFEKSVGKVTLATLPFIAILLVALMVITYVPELSLGLIHLLGVQ
ncbi:MAG: TRAP transporter large permease subunit [Ignavibacteriales bacterium]|nr:TRAP transporter large permease subunit [Ignavibacteriales bacterium]